MNKDNFLNLMKDPLNTGLQDKQALSGILRSFPYFQSAHMLYMLNRSHFTDEEFENILRESALIIPERKLLFNRLHEEKQPEAVVSEKSELLIDKEKPVTDISEMTTAETLLEIDEDENSEKAKVVEFDMNHDFAAYKVENDFELIEENDTTEDNSEEPGQNFDLIQKFIEENPAFTPNKLDLNEERKDISLSSIQENEELATETLAMVYTTQKLYDKAISIYEKLILKFPEKSTYFAGRINELKENLKNS